MEKNKQARIFRLYVVSLLLLVGLCSLGGGIMWYLSRSRSDTLNLSKSTVNETPVPSKRDVDYTQLREYLHQKDWKKADRETYLRLLEAAGPKAQANGMIPQDEMDNLSCSDLKTIDQLWSKATNGQQGFTVQVNILKALSDYRQMYAKVGWQELPPSNQWLFQWTYNTQTKRMEFVKGKEPNYLNPPPGHLPTVEIGYNINVAFSGALTRCNF
ncbi:GUN4 domain-containing protein [Aetokthonos hydrillicola Thurmond2011]|jgi:hypothetical protein|uniref:GUN4 domain-containing protein n=1 Tax=Aetokthonos hydrillicola Thurmond2011 TaxID=2712845 RepID=A0AAP5MBM0_9CYAN|nr:GUN4 domain-containing protein [Aetokthonos hydrillicola]MBO3461475.1 GUN4 domain-containing protein [Aetokthonos hydrillicola CCALA 1050]MBW4584886.1 GUN4 domain-containing protein [Aetokthonos hydrillicola CCALA 1050]MDR9898082.1 GUN4 domain-containing protein [Aetokthonos hydrillicola Thurmond2011]